MVNHRFVMRSFFVCVRFFFVPCVCVFLHSVCVCVFFIPCVCVFSSFSACTLIKCVYVLFSVRAFFFVCAHSFRVCAFFIRVCAVFLRLYVLFCVCACFLNGCYHCVRPRPCVFFCVFVFFFHVCNFAILQ